MHDLSVCKRFVKISGAEICCPVYFTQGFTTKSRIQSNTLSNTGLCSTQCMGCKED